MPAPSISSRIARDIATNASASRSHRLRKAVAPRASRPAGPLAHALPHVHASPLSSPFVSGCITTGMPDARAATRPGRPSTRVPRTTRTSWPEASRSTARTAAGSMRNFPVLPGPGGGTRTTRMPSSRSSAGHAGSARRVTTVAASPAATRAAPSRRTWVSPPPRIGWNDSARKRTRVNGPGPARLPVLARPPLLHHVDGLALALVPGAHQELTHEAEADEDHPGQEEQRAEEQQGAPADRLVEDDLEDGKVGEDRGAARAESVSPTRPKRCAGRVP